MRFGQSENSYIEVEKNECLEYQKAGAVFACYGNSTAGSNPAQNPIRVCGAIESLCYVVASQNQCQNQNGSHGLDGYETDRGPPLSREPTTPRGNKITRIGGGPPAWMEMGVLEALGVLFHDGAAERVAHMGRPGPAGEDPPANTQRHRARAQRWGDWWNKTSRV